MGKDLALCLFYYEAVPRGTWIKEGKRLMKDKELYSIKDVCIKYGITRKALFYYDRIDLLKPTKREGKQQFKYYDDNALFRLEAILEYRSAGLTIEETKQIIDLKDKKQKLEILLRVKERLKKEANQKQEEIRSLNTLIELNSL